MVGCSVMGCKSRNERQDGITFHSFPTDVELRKIWTAATGRINWQPTQYTKMCSVHFDPDRFRFTKKLVCLKPDTVPKRHIHTNKPGDQENQEKSSRNPLEQFSKLKELLSRDYQNGPANRRNCVFTRFPTTNNIHKRKWISKIGRKKKLQPRNHSKDLDESEIFSKDLDERDVVLMPHLVPANTSKSPKKDCNFCQKSFMSPLALSQHLKKVHQTKNIMVEFPSNTISHNRPPNLDHLLLDSSVSFACPICSKSFPSQFVAQKHIDVYHDNNDNTLKPMRLVECLICKQKLTGETHICKNKTEQDEYECLGCKQTFKYLIDFDQHLFTFHREELESLFFPSMKDFLDWKKSIEIASTVTYVAQEPGTTKSRKFYHCMRKNFEENKNKKALCSSTIVVELYNEGVHALFFKNHHQHHYTVSDIISNTLFQTYSLSKSFDNTNFFKSNGSMCNLNEDPYLNLKVILENIIEEAAKINVDGLKNLMGKALQMTTILNNFDEDVDLTVRKRTQFLSDAEITRELESTPVTKKVRFEDNTKAVEDPLGPKIIDTFSLSDTRDSDNNSETDSCDEKLSDCEGEEDIDYKILKSNNEGSSITSKKAINLEEELNINKEVDKEFSCFNDTYKHFVTKNFVDVAALKETQEKKKQTPSIDVSSIKQEIDDEDSNNSRGTPNNRIKKNGTATPRVKVRTDIIDTSAKGLNLLGNRREVDKKEISRKTQHEVKKKVIYPIGPKEIKRKGLSPKVNKSIKKEIVPTPLKVTSEPLKSLKSPEKKVDIEYEVIEQESDCNILVLKL